jgi:hypothetical protein
MTQNDSEIFGRSRKNSVWCLVFGVSRIDSPVYLPIDSLLRSG